MSFCKSTKPNSESLNERRLCLLRKMKNKTRMYSSCEETLRSAHVLVSKGGAVFMESELAGLVFLPIRLRARPRGACDFPSDGLCSTLMASLDTLDAISIC